MLTRKMAETLKALSLLVFSLLSILRFGRVDSLKQIFLFYSASLLKCRYMLHFKRKMLHLLHHLCTKRAWAFFLSTS